MGFFPLYVCSFFLHLFRGFAERGRSEVARSDYSRFVKLYEAPGSEGGMEAEGVRSLCMPRSSVGFVSASVFWAFEMAWWL